MVPLSKPLQVMSVLMVVCVGVVFGVTVIVLLVAGHPLESDTVNTYVPATVAVYGNEATAVAVPELCETVYEYGVT